ncbi:GAD-like domain-containing protein [Fibrella sp. WM1]|uniref:GAD-like domain-containing protein n=1 Tax=Fibrella musci TaxID=3242485 RepID=UPI003520A01B
MFEKFFEKYPLYHIVKKPTEQQIDSYRNVLPSAIITIWQEYGYGIFADGYLRFINPDDWTEFVKKYIENTGYEYIPIAVSAFGDLFVWKTKKEGFLELYDFRHGDFKTVSTSTGLDILFDMDFLDDSFIWDELNASNYKSIKVKLGTPNYDQCYGYVPLLALGGRESIEHIQIVDLRVHMELMAQVSGPL